MNHSEKLKDVELLGFTHEQLRHCCNNIKSKVACKIILSNSFKFFMSSSLLNEIKKNFDEHDNINSHFNFLKVLLRFFFECASFFIRVTYNGFACYIHFWENKHEWSNEKRVHGQ